MRDQNLFILVFFKSNIKQFQTPFSIIQEDFSKFKRKFKGLKVWYLKKKAFLGVPFSRPGHKGEGCLSNIKHGIPRLFPDFSLVFPDSSSTFFYFFPGIGPLKIRNLWNLSTFSHFFYNLLLLHRFPRLFSSFSWLFVDIFHTCQQHFSLWRK